MEQRQLGRDLGMARIVPAHKVGALQEAAVEGGPVTLDAGGELGPAQLQRANEVVRMEGLHLGRSAVGGDGPGQRHQARQIALQRYHEGLDKQKKFTIKQTTKESGRGADIFVERFLATVVTASARWSL